MKYITSISRMALLPLAFLTGATVAAAQGLPPPERSRGSTMDAGPGFASDFSAAKQQASRIEFLEHPDEHDTNYKVAMQFAECAIDFNEKRARELLDDEMQEKAGSLTLSKFLVRNKGCVVTTAAMDRDFLRGSIAEALIVSPEWTAPLPAATDADGAKAFLKAVRVNNMSTEDPFSMGQLAAECRVAFAPVSARALMETERGSDAEKITLDALRGSTPQCDGFKAEPALTTYFERAFTAQALYHWFGFSASGG